MSNYHGNLEESTLNNDNFRQVLFTAPHCQLVVMSLLPGEEIGEEVHELDQFFRVESGQGEAVLDGVAYPLSDGMALVVPEGVKHNIVNTSANEKLKLYTIYAPAEHPAGTIHRTKAEADLAESH